MLRLTPFYPALDLEEIFLLTMKTSVNASIISNLPPPIAFRARIHHKLHGDIHTMAGLVPLNSMDGALDSVGNSEMDLAIRACLNDVKKKLVKVIVKNWGLSCTQNASLATTPMAVASATLTN